MIPASNQKLLVAAVALDVLGPDHRYRTELRSARPFGGVVPGNVYLVGGGDPVLRTADVADPQQYPAFNTTALEPLADQLVALGVTSIEGDVVGDGSRYDDEFWLDEWGPDIIRIEAGPYDALLVNDGLIGASSPGQLRARPDRGPRRRRSSTCSRPAASPSPAAPATVRRRPTSSSPRWPSSSRCRSPTCWSRCSTPATTTRPRLVLKEIGFAASGQGTRQAGLDAVRATLDSWGVADRHAPAHRRIGAQPQQPDELRAARRPARRQPRRGRSCVDLLPAAGRDGTLADQFLGSVAEGSLVAKTGTLTDVKALSGEQPGSDGRPVEFSLVLNAPGADEPDVYLPVWDALVELIDTYPVEVEPDVAAFEPR